VPNPVQLTGRKAELFALLQRHPAGLTADGIRQYMFAGYASPGAVRMARMRLARALKGTGWHVVATPYASTLLFQLRKESPDGEPVLRQRSA
jgi:hypothetical protein